MAATNKAARSADPLDIIVPDLERVIAILLWKGRYRNPELAEQILLADITGFQDCVEYLNVEPRVLIRRPPGQPAYPAMPPSKRYPEGAPARPAEPPRPYVQVSLVDKDGNAFKPIENSEAGAKIRDESNELRALRDRVPLLAASVVGNAAQNVFSSAEISELANAATRLARA